MVSGKLKQNMKKANDSTKDEILTVLQQSEKDLAAYEVAKEVSVGRETVGRHCKEMVENGTVIRSRSIGGVPLYDTKQ